MAHEDDHDMEMNLETNMMKNENLSKTEHDEKQIENQKPVEKKQQDVEDTTSSSSYKRVLECLEILQDGYSKMDLNRICETLAENVVWMDHPHDVSRHYVGHEAVKEFLTEEFDGVEETKMIYFSEFLIHDEKRGVVHVEWLKSKQDTNPDGNHRERHSSHAVIIQFKNNLIQVIKFHSIKTNKYWTKTILTKKLDDGEKQPNQKQKSKRNSKNTSRSQRSGRRYNNKQNTSRSQRSERRYNNKKNVHRGNGKNGSRSRRNDGRRNNNKKGKNDRNGRRNNKQDGHRGGQNGVSRNNGGYHDVPSNENKGDDYVPHNITELKPVAEEIENQKPITNETSSTAPSRSRRRRRGKGGNRNNARNQKRGRRGKGKRGSGKPKKKQWVPWTCSRCNFQNEAEATSCKNCEKKFDHREDLSEEQKQQLRNISKEEEEQPQEIVPLPNDTESNV